MEQTETLSSVKTAARPLWFYVVSFAVVIGSYGLFYGPTFVELGSEWLTYIAFSYCAVIPLMSLYVVWTRRRLLAQIPIIPSFIGLILLGSALLIALMGKAVGESFVVQVSTVLALAGLVQLIFGTKFLIAILFPVAYLTLMVPFPYTIVKEVAYYLRMFDAIAAAQTLQMMGIPVYRDAYFLHLPDITLEVADLCSGISSVFALFALGSYYAYFLPLGTGAKLLAVASTFPVAALVNLLRIILTGILAYYVGPAALGYVIHELTGTITFFVALGIFVGLAEFLQRRFLGLQRGTASIQGDRANAGIDALPEKKELNFAPARRQWLALLLGCSMLVGASFFSMRLEAARPFVFNPELERIPGRIGEYSLRNESMDLAYHDANAERQITRTYGDFRSTIELFVGYRSYQSAEKRLASPKLSLTGWNIVALEPASLRVSAAEALNGVWMTLHNGKTNQLVFYWYQAGRSTFGGEVGYRLFQMKRLIFDNRSDVTVIRISTAVGEGEQVEQTKARVIAFTSNLYPALKRILPQ